MKIRLGFEVGTGDPVDVPLGHTIICGQSQKAGKTTALEALAARGAPALRPTDRPLAVLAFRTKRGEGAFGGGNRVEPFFRERADWQFVEAILESTMKQKMRFERAWIMRATRGARTLVEVQKNVRSLMAKATRSMDRDMYMMLGEYLDIVVPAVARLRSSPPALEPGANVMDLVGMAPEVQGLVIASALERVLADEEGVVSVVPEAWEFMPQGRNSPVRMAAAALARKGAALRNFLWVDSQDLAGVEKEIIRQAEVWLLGVQREANEVARALACIPAGIKKPKADDVAGLELGQFWCCLPGGVARKVYVQPAWMDEAPAIAVARGDSTPELAAILSSRKQALDSAALTARVVLGPELRRAVADDLAAGQRAIAALTGAEPFEVRAESTDEEESEMSEATMKAVLDLGDRLDRMIEKIDQVLGDQGQGLRPPRGETKFPNVDSDRAAKQFAKMVDEARGKDRTGAFAGDEDELFARFRDRLLKDPKILRVLALEKRIDVSVETEVVEADGKTLRGRLALLLKDGWFDEAKTPNQAWGEVKRRGYPSKSNGAPGQFYGEFTWFAEAGFMTKEGERYQAVGDAKARVKVSR